jgi:tRNA threonylcarbamoyladenosine biosynthesis protein TsaB
MPADTFFISIQATYQSLEIALFNNDQCIATILHEHARASSALISVLQTILQANAVQFSQIAFIAVDAGPGAFTSLRVVIATVNGIAFTSGMPLVSVSSFEGFAAQFPDKQLLVLLNAFNNDVYFAYAAQQQVLVSGCTKYHQLPLVLPPDSNQGVVSVVGNGLQAYPQAKEVVGQLFSSYELLSPTVPSAKAIGLVAYKKWHDGETVKKIEPLYLKTLVYKEAAK